MAAPEPAVASYRERLRSGGRGAFQRAADAGFAPKPTRQEWNPMAQDETFWYQQANAQNGAAMHYDAQLIWSGPEQMQGNDCWSTSMNQSQMATQYSYMQQAPELQLQSPELLQMSPMMTPQQPEIQQMQQGAQMPQMQVAMEMTGSQMQTTMFATSSDNMQADFDRQQFLQQTQQMPQMPTSMLATGSDGMPAEFDRCMAIVMPGTAQFQGDKDLMAAQLRAAADCQCYED